MNQIVKSKIPWPDGPSFWSFCMVVMISIKCDAIPKIVFVWPQHFDIRNLIVTQHPIENKNTFRLFPISHLLTSFQWRFPLPVRSLRRQKSAQTGGLRAVGRLDSWCGFSEIQQKRLTFIYCILLLMLSFFAQLGFPGWWDLQCRNRSTVLLHCEDRFTLASSPWWKWDQENLQDSTALSDGNHNLWIDMLAYVDNCSSTAKQTINVQLGTFSAAVTLESTFIGDSNWFWSFSLSSLNPSTVHLTIPPKVTSIMPHT